MSTSTTRTVWSASWLALRSVLWSILVPGIVVGYVPWQFVGPSETRLDSTNIAQLAGLACVAVGAALMTTCIVEFARSGRGTLSPLDPPRQLVVRGFYRYVRNPMYLGATVVLLGEALVRQSRALVVYWVVWFVWVNVFVIAYEEPSLRRRFGASYEEYTRRVGRWIPSRPAERSA